MSGLEDHAGNSVFSLFMASDKAEVLMKLSEHFSNQISHRPYREDLLFVPNIFIVQLSSFSSNKIIF